MNQLDLFTDARLADEYDAAQKRGEVAGPADRHSSSREELNKAKAEDIGLTRKQVHEARQIRDAEIIRFPVRIWASQIWQPVVVPIITGMQSRKTEKGRASFWKREVIAMEKQLRAGGATESEITAELHRFRQVVIAEMARRRLTGRKGPGAA